VSLFLERFQIDGDGIIHVEHRRLDDGGQLFGKRLSLLTGKERWPLLFHEATDELRHDKRIAADIPARLQADAGMGAADGSNTIHIALVEIAARKIAPMFLLALLGVAHMGLVGEEACYRRGLCKLAVELVECAAEKLRDRRP
jgi:hypothetical protein